MNALSPQLFDELTAIFTALTDDSEAYVVVVSGQGKHFSSGLDLNAAAGALAGPKPRNPRHFDTIDCITVRGR